MQEAARNPGCTVLVASCDKYADLIRPFSALFSKYWPDCPFERVLVTETPVPADGTCFDRVVANGPGGNWCSRLAAALDTISTPRVLLLCDDYFLESRVDTARFMVRLAQAEEHDAANLRLIPNPKPAADFGEGLGRYRCGTAYCISTLAGVWRRTFLRSLAAKYASIWEFERYGSFAVSPDDGMLLVTHSREFPFVDAVHKGCWEKFGIAVCRANGIEPDFSHRGLPPVGRRIAEAFKALVFAVFPATLIVRVQNALGIGAKERRVAEGCNP